MAFQARSCHTDVPMPMLGQARYSESGQKSYDKVWQKLKVVV